MRYLLLVLLFGTLAHPARGQAGAVSGRVTDAEGRPLPGVNLVLEDTFLGTASGADGRYRLAGVPPGRHVLRASAVGFETVRRPVEVEPGGRAVTDFRLAEATVRSDEVVVSASRREQLARRAPVSVSVLGAAGIEARGSLSLDEALRHAPGVQLAGNQVNVRGSSGFSYGVGSRVLLLVDGVPMLGPDTGDLRFDLLPLSRVERIEILKGPGSALYGSGALGGVVNVVTRSAPERPETRVELSGGAYEPVRYPEWRAGWPGAASYRPFGAAGATHARRAGERLGGWISASYRGDRGYLRHNRFDQAQLFGKLEARPRPALKLELLGGGTYLNRDFFYFWESARDALQPGRPELVASGTNDSDVQLRASLLPSLTHLVSARFFYTVRARLFHTAIYPLDASGRLKPDHSRTFADRYGAELQLNYALSPTRFLVAGVAGDGLRARSKFYEGEDARRVRGQPEGAVFLQAEQELGRLTLVGGARYDLYGLDRGETVTRLSPKLALSLAVHPRLALRASSGGGFRVPAVAERFVNDRQLLPIDPNVRLRPEESTGYEAGFNLLLPLSRRWGARLDAAGFWTDYRRLVELKFDESRNAFRFVNLTRARVRGLEAVLEAGARDERLLASAGYTLLDATDLTEREPLAFRPRHLLNASATWRPLPRLEAGADLRVASRPERVDTDFIRFVKDADLMVPTRVLDLRLGFSPRPSWQLSLHLRNALEYYYLERPAFLAPPRHLMVRAAAEL